MDQRELFKSAWDMILELDYKQLGCINNYGDWESVDEFLHHNPELAKKWVIGFKIYSNCHPHVSIVFIQNIDFRSAPQTMCLVDTNHLDIISDTYLSAQYPRMIQFLKTWNRDYKISIIDGSSS